jgi:hypothetical protein
VGEEVTAFWVGCGSWDSAAAGSKEH